MVSRYGQPANALTARPGTQVNDPRRNALIAYKQGLPANALTAPQPQVQSAPPPLPQNPNPQGGAIAPGEGPTLNVTKGNVAPPAPTMSARDQAIEKMREKARLASANRTPDPFGGYDDLAAQRQQLEQQRGVEERKLQSEKAAALQEARARMNLAGAGLSGLGAANEGRIASDQNAGRIDALSAFDANARASLRDTAADQRAVLADERDKLRFDAELWDYEDQFNADIDGDGTVGAPGSSGRANAEDALLTLDGAGTRESPFVLDAGTMDQLSGPLGLRRAGTTSAGVELWVDDSGRVYSMSKVGQPQASGPQGKTYDPDTGAWV